MFGIEEGAGRGAVRLGAAACRADGAHLEEGGAFAVALLVGPHFGFELGNVLLLSLARRLLLRPA